MAVLPHETDDLDARVASTLGALVDTTKPGITKLVVFTSLAGFVVTASVSSLLSFEIVLSASACAIGTAAAAAGANALNMWMEAGLDRLMPRTKERPLPARVLTPQFVLMWGVLLVTLGVGVLLFTIGPAPALLALLSAALYLFIYTPMKTRTPWCTVVGAIPGALPTLIGAAAASPSAGLASWTEPTGLALFALLAIWQLPHFFALAWMYRADYAAAGMRMISVTDPTGRSTRVATVITAALLLPATLAPGFVSPMLGWPYLAVAATTGIAFFALTVAMARATDQNADTASRRVFFASITHLPLLLIAMSAEALVRAFLAGSV